MWPAPAVSETTPSACCPSEVHERLDKMSNGGARNISIALGLWKKYLISNVNKKVNINVITYHKNTMKMKSCLMW